jgi:DNA-binding Lrp family transcriptional regulator
MKNNCIERKCSECGKIIKCFKDYKKSFKLKDKNLCKNCNLKIIEKKVLSSNLIIKSKKYNKMKTICFILISSAPSYEEKIIKKLSKIPEIVEFHQLDDWYDIIVEIKANNYENLGNFIENNIKSIEGIEDTVTLTGSF